MLRADLVREMAARGQRGELIPDARAQACRAERRYPADPSRQARPTAPIGTRLVRCAAQGESVAIQPITIADRPFDSRSLESAIAKGVPGQAAHIRR